MPDIVMILWLPIAIAGMAVAWVLTLSTVGPKAADEPRRHVEEVAGPPNH